MSEAILQSLTSAGSGLLGALIGFGGSLIVSLRAERIARDQVRYARSHERRDEALGTVYGMLRDLSNAFTQWVDTPLEFESSHERGRQVSELIGELNLYYSKMAVWMPLDITQEIQALLNGYLSWQEKAMNASASDQAYDEVRKQAAEWLREKALPRATKIQIMIRGVLGVKEPDDGARRPW